MNDNQDLIRLPQVNVLDMLLADKRSPHTKRAYARAVAIFFQDSYGEVPTPALLEAFLTLDTPAMVRRILEHKGQMIAEQYSEATINMRMSAILSLVRFGRRIGATTANPDDSIDIETVKPYRDTRGISVDQARALLAQPDRSTIKGKRDFTLLLLMLENALRRSELCGITLTDIDLDAREVFIIGKGRGTQRERVTISPTTAEAIHDYLRATNRRTGGAGYLFINLSPAYQAKARQGDGLTTDGIFKMVYEYALQAGIGKCSPHQLRHTSITAALDASGGDVRKVRKLSRHAKLETLVLYDDNRTDMQGEVTNMLSDLFGDRKP